MYGASLEGRIRSFPHLACKKNSNQNLKIRNQTLLAKYSHSDREFAFAYTDTHSAQKYNNALLI